MLRATWLGHTRQDRLIQVRSWGKADVAWLTVLLRFPILNSVKLEQTWGPPEVTKLGLVVGLERGDGLLIPSRMRDQPCAPAGSGDGDRDQSSSQHAEPLCQGVPLPLSSP